MTRMKRTRTPGQVKSSKGTRETQEQSKERRRKAKRKGLAPGSRQNVPELNSKSSGDQAKKDPRLGSKKPIELVPNAKKSAAQTTKPVKEQGIAKVTKVDDPELQSGLTAEQELEQLESNERLNSLLDAVDAGKKLDKADAAWLDKTLARHQQLLEQLGLLDEDETEPAEGDDLWTQFMAAEFDPAQYEDKEDKS